MAESILERAKRFVIEIMVKKMIEFEAVKGGETAGREEAEMSGDIAYRVA